MALKSIFDPAYASSGWFDPVSKPEGWFDQQFVASGLAGITADFSAVEANDTISSTAALAIAAAMSATEAGDTVSGSATVAIAASLSVTEAGDTISSAATLALAANLSITEGGDTEAAAGTLPIKGAAALLDADSILASAGVLPIKADAAIVSTADLINSDGTLSSGGITADFAVTEDSDTSIATGSTALYGRNYAGGKFSGWRPLKKKKRTEEDELEELEALLEAAAKARPKLEDLRPRPPITYHGPLSVAFYDPPIKRTRAVNAIMAKATEPFSDDEEALLLLMD